MVVKRIKFYSSYLKRMSEATAVERAEMGSEARRWATRKVGPE